MNCQHALMCLRLIPNDGAQHLWSNPDFLLKKYNLQAGWQGSHNRQPLMHDKMQVRDRKILYTHYQEIECSDRPIVDDKSKSLPVVINPDW